VTTSRLVVYVFVIVFCAIGAGLMYGAINKLQDGDTTPALIMLAAGFVFAGFGLGVLAISTVAFRRQAKEESLRAAHPDEPWMWREDWIACRVRSTNKAETWFLAGFAVLWNLFCLPMVYFLGGEIIDNKNYAALIGLLFPLVGIGLIVAVVRKAIQRQKYGDCVFEMSRVPGVLGGEVAGVILVPRGLSPSASLALRLSCIHRQRRGSGRNSSTTETLLWQTDQTAARLSPMVDGSVHGAPVRFNVPFDASPTGEIDANTRILWKLDASADVPGVDFATDFEIPVFRTQASSPRITEEQIRAEEVTAESSAGLTAEQVGVTIVPGPLGGTEYILKPQGNLRSSVPGILFTLGFAGITALLAYAGAPVIFPFFFGAFVSFFIVALLFGAFGESHVLVEEKNLTVRNMLFGFQTSKTIPCASIAKIGVKGEVQPGKQGHYSITFTQGDGKTISPFQILPVKDHADWLAEELRKAMEPWRGKELCKGPS